MSEEKVNTTITLKNVRLSFPDIFVPQYFKKGKPAPNEELKFRASFIMDKAKNAAEIKAVKAGIVQVLKDNHKGKKIPAEKLCLRDGEGKDYDGYDETMMSVTASNGTRPTIVDRDRTPLVAEDGKPYAGCYVNAVINLWWQNNDFGKRVNASLGAIQFVKDGEPFGAGSVDANAAFDDLSVDDDSVEDTDDDDDEEDPLA